MAKGKGKGQQFERDVCELLSKWMTRGKRRDLFWRSAMSGGRATRMHKAGRKNLSQGGDICAIDKEGCPLTDKVAIECKFLKKLDFHQSILRGYGTLQRKWTETLAMGSRQVKIPVLIAKANFFPAVVVLNQKGYDFFQLDPVESLCVVYFGSQKKYILLLDIFLREATAPK